MKQKAATKVVVEAIKRTASQPSTFDRLWATLTRKPLANSIVKDPQAALEATVHC